MRLARLLMTATFPLIYPKLLLIRSNVGEQSFNCLPQGWTFIPSTGQISGMIISDGSMVNGVLFLWARSLTSRHKYKLYLCSRIYFLYARRCSLRLGREL